MDNLTNLSNKVNSPICNEPYAPQCVEYRSIGRAMGYMIIINPHLNCQIFTVAIFRLENGCARNFIIDFAKPIVRSIIHVAVDPNRTVDPTYGPATMPMKSSETAKIEITGVNHRSPGMFRNLIVLKLVSKAVELLA